MAAQFLAMFPFGWITLNCYTTASLHVPQRDLGVAIGLIGTFRSLGGAVGSVLFSSIFAQTAEKSIASRIGQVAGTANVNSTSIPSLIAAARLTILGVPGEAAKFPNVSSTTFEEMVRAARYGYAYGFRITWLASIPFGVIAVICAISVRDPSRYFTNHVEVHLEREIGKGSKGKRQSGKEEAKVEEKVS